jgi:hypothetical protein
VILLNKSAQVDPNLIVWIAILILFFCVVIATIGHLIPVIFKGFIGAMG